MAFGAFLTSREIFGNDLWTDVVKFRLFFYIVGNAVFAEDGVKKGGIHIQRGQYLRSLRNLREDLVHFENNSEKMYSLATLKRKIDELVAEERITVVNTKLGTLFTVVNYAKYQDFEYYKGGSLEHQRNSNETVKEQQRNSNETPSEHQKNDSETVTKHQKNSNETLREQQRNNNNNVNKDINVIKDNQVNKVIKDKQDINDNHENKVMNEIKDNNDKKEKNNQPPAPNMSNSVDKKTGEKKKEKEVVVGGDIPFNEQLVQVEKAYEFAIGSVDESISKNLAGFLGLYKDHRLITAALNELAQTEDANALSINSIPAVISKWRSKGIHSYEQLESRAVSQ